MMENFIKKVQEAKTLSQTDVELERARDLRSFLKKKSKTGNQEALKELIEKSGNDAEKLILIKT